MQLKAILFTLASITYIHNTIAFTFQVDRIITTDQKKITFLADGHAQSPYDKEQIDCILNFLHQNNESDFHVLIEQAAPIDKKYASAYEMLFRLDEYIKKANPPLTHVNLENIEIRHIMGAASHILESDQPYVCNTYRDLTIDDTQKTFGTITFQDILDEFNTNKELLSDYYLNNLDEAIATIYDQHMQCANEQYEQLQKKLDSIPSYATTTVLAYAQKQYVLTKTLETNKELAKTMSDAFLHVLDLHILQTILTSKSNNIIVVAGGAHTKKIIPLLTEHLKASCLYSEKNHYCLIEAEQEDGSKQKMIQKKPVTTAQMLRGLSDKPETYITEHNNETLSTSPDMCCTLF